MRRFRKQAVLGARETVYYADLFKRLDLNPAKLTYEDIARIPLTPKEDIRDNLDAFARRTARPALRTTTTGTTGRPTSVLFCKRNKRNDAESSKNPESWFFDTSLVYVVPKGFVQQAVVQMARRGMPRQECA